MPLFPSKLFCPIEPHDQLAFVVNVRTLPVDHILRDGLPGIAEGLLYVVSSYSAIVGWVGEQTIACPMVSYFVDLVLQGIPALLDLVQVRRVGCPIEGEETELRPAVGFNI